MKSSLLIFLSLLSGNLCCTGAYADDITHIINTSEAEGAKAANEASRLVEGFRKHATKESKSASQIVVPNLPPSASSRKYPKQEILKGVLLPHEGKGECKDNATQGSGKCPSSLFEYMDKKQASHSLADTKLFIFVSESVPPDSIKQLWDQAQRVGGKLLFRGLVGGSFKATQQHIEELGIVAELDPTKFEEFGINQVPAFVLSKEGMYDKMVGNISLNEFLEQASGRGNLKEEAGKLAKNLQEERP